MKQNSLVLPVKERGKLVHFDICQSTLFLPRPAFKGNIFFNQCLTLGKGKTELQPVLIFHVGEGKYSTSAHSRFPQRDREIATTFLL